MIGSIKKWYGGKRDKGCGGWEMKGNGRQYSRSTCDLRLHTAEDFGVFEIFSVGDITVRKANDPSYIV
jgi:hypothetical protein